MDGIPALPGAQTRPYPPMIAALDRVWKLKVTV